jgi:hypothetical protein
MINTHSNQRFAWSLCYSNEKDFNSKHQNLEINNSIKKLILKHYTENSEDLR